MSFEYWFLLPISILISTVAMAAGVEGATFFTPMFILALGLPADIAIGTGLITEIFGFASGVSAYARRRLIDYRFGKQLLWVTLPLALVGAWLTGIVPPEALKVLLGLGLLAIAVTFLLPDKLEERARSDSDTVQEHVTILKTADGDEIRYRVCNIRTGRFFAGVGALFIGMISTGQGELNGYFFLKRCRLPAPVAIATSVFVVAITALVASVSHVVKFVTAGGDTLTTVLNLVMFTVPGVLIGGQIGPWVASRISQSQLERGLAFLFIAVALLTLWEVIFR